MIQFANPAALWLLLLAVPIILLYLLKRKRREVVVPSLLLWKQALEDLRAQTPFQKLRTNLLLFIQLLVLVLIVSILSQPYLPGTGKSRKWILVLDTSASMKATDEKPNRFEIAQKKLIEALDSTNPLDEILLISFSNETSVLQSFSKNHAAVRRRLQNLKPQDIPGNWNQLMLILRPLCKEKPAPTILIASDFANFPERQFAGITFRPVPVGSSGDNAGITRAVIEPLPENPSTQVLFYQIQNFSRASKNVDVELRLGNDVIDAYVIALKAGQTLEKSAELRVVKNEMLKISLTPADSFAPDNDFVIAVRPAQKTAVQTNIQNPFLQKALRVLPSIRLTSDAPIHIASKIEDGAGIYFLPASDSAAAGTVVHWNETHPSLRFLDASFWKFQHCLPLQIPAGADVLLETEQGPIGYASTENDKPQIVFGFALEDSNLPMLGAFPVLLQNSIRWIDSYINKAPVTLTDKTHPVEGPVAGSSDYVNFSDAAESAILPRKPVVQAQPGRTNVTLDHRDVVTWFLIVLTAMIMLEWWAFHRRVV